MKKRVCIGLMMALALAGILTNVSCADKVVAQPDGEVGAVHSPEPIPAPPAPEPQPVVESAPEPVVTPVVDPAPPEPAAAGAAEDEQPEKKAARERFLDQHVYFAFDADQLDTMAAVD